MGWWPKGWAERGDAQSKAPKSVANSMSFSFRALIEGRDYSRPVKYTRFHSQPNSECVARRIYTESYPSGGSAEYACHAYKTRDGQWETDGEWDYHQVKVNDPKIEWYLVEEK